ncbi:MAG: C40 family peptidase [Candidatus Marinimicrobia bacterium]|nr:C40 family peptidase [Candidatus Neomarinimicrobiota bacterium]
MQKTVRTPVANLYGSHTFMSDQVTQALMGETVEILDSHQSWFKVRQWDDYESWMHEFYLLDIGHSATETYFFDRHTTQLICDDGSEIYLPFGVELPIEQKNENTVTVLLPWGDRGECVLPPKKNLERKVDQLIVNARKFNGVQYQWGGISTFGCDCSGFVQTIFKSVGVKLPRDSHQQFDTHSKIDFEDVEKGDLLFFMEKDNIDHVAISLGDSQIIHCSGFVKEEPLHPTATDYNKKLRAKFYGAMSIKGLL